jgi:hypothetical protein
MIREEKNYLSASENQSTRVYRISLCGIGIFTIQLNIRVKYFAFDSKNLIFLKKVA